jgi:hypothetical protein
VGLSRVSQHGSFLPRRQDNPPKPPRFREGEFQGQIGVSEHKIGDQSYGDIPFSVLNRDALSKISFTDPRSQTSQLFIPSIAGLNVPRLIVHVVPPAFEATSPLFIAPALFAQWIELDPTYTIALKPRPSC